MAFIDGTSSIDFLDGSSSNDVIRGLDGNDTIRGLTGNDSINGNESEDYVNGNQGADTLRGGRGNDTILGGQGNDFILGDLGNDFLYGDRGSDTLEGGDGNDLFAIGAGYGGSTIQDADVITDFRGDGTGGTPRDLIGLLRTNSSQSLDDLFNGLNITVVNGDTIIREALSGEYLAVVKNFDRILTISDFNIAQIPPSIFPPNSTPTPSPGPSPSPTPGPTPTPSNSVYITVSDSTAAESGTSPSDTGTFLISRIGSVGNLTVNLGITGTATNSVDYTTIPTTVTIPDGSTSTIITVKPIDDALVESTETVTLTIASGSGYSISSPSTGTVSILDNDVAAIPTGTNGADSIFGSTANDFINGIGGNDTLNGNAGNDTIIGGSGNDILTGGTGADVFVFNSLAEGIDTITDFNASEGDKIQISASGFGGGLVGGTPLFDYNADPVGGAMTLTGSFFVGSGVTGNPGLQAGASASISFAYNTDVSRLSVDTDGAAIAQAYQTLTFFSNGYVPSVADFVVVG